MNPLNYIQRAILVNEFTASKLQSKHKPCSAISMVIVHTLLALQTEQHVHILTVFSC